MSVFFSRFIGMEPAFEAFILVAEPQAVTQ